MSNIKKDFESLTEVAKNKSKEKLIASGKDISTFKSYSILAILFLIVTSDVFINNVLCTFKCAVNGKDVTLIGALLQIIILIIVHIFIISNI